MPTGQYAALILAAGLSSRMGKGFKPLLPIPFPEGSRSALESLARLYGEAGVGRIVVVGGRRRGAEVAAEARRLGLDFVENARATQDMFSSVRAGLEALGDSTRACFAHPADIPLVRLCALRLLLAEAEAAADDILIPSFKGEPGHPPLLPARHIPAIIAWGGENGLRGALQGLPCRATPVADRNILLDMDTDADYAEVCARASGRHSLEPAEAEELLRCLGVEARGLAHARAVSLVAGKFARALNDAAGSGLDPALAEAGGLLHDLCKGEAAHERAAGAKLRALGLPALARLAEGHRDCVLPDNEPLTEKEIVYLADKYVQNDRPVSLRERYGRQLARWGGAEAGIAGRLARAEGMEQRLRRECGAEPLELARDALNPGPRA